MLLSHDHHPDNLDRIGRTLLGKARTVFTTEEGAQRLGGNSAGLSSWRKMDLQTPEGRTFCVVATPARHGPEGLNRGVVSGFVLFFADAPRSGVYVSGDTVWYDSVAEVAKRFDIRAAILHMGRCAGPGGRSTSPHNDGE